MEKDTPQGFLSGVKVVEVGYHIAGPLCAKMLADYGARVIKIERPGAGDGARHTGPFVGDDPNPEKSILFLYLNTNKKGITLNLGTATGRRLFLELIDDAQVLVENLEPGTMADWGLDYDDLKQANPALIETSISNFGQTGPYSQYKAWDMVEYAMSGLMYHTGAYDREPLKLGPPLAQYLGGLASASATMLALLHQQMTGQGQHVDVSMMEAVLMLLSGSELPLYSYAGAVSRREAKDGPGLMGILPCKDGHSVLIGFGGAGWEGLVSLLDAPELLEERFSVGRRGRYGGTRELREVVLPKLQQRGRFDLFHQAQQLGLAYGVVQSPADLAQCPQLLARDFYREVEHPVIGRARIPGPTMEMSETPWRVTRPAPLLGQHNAEIYVDKLGYSLAELVRFRQAGVI